MNFLDNTASVAEALNLSPEQRKVLYMAVADDINAYMTDLTASIISDRADTYDRPGDADRP